MGSSVMSGRRWISFGTMKMSSPRGPSTGDFSVVLKSISLFFPNHRKLYAIHFFFLNSIENLIRSYKNCGVIFNLERLSYLGLFGLTLLLCLDTCY